MLWQDVLIIVCVVIVLVSLYDNRGGNSCRIEISGGSATATACSAEQLDAIKHGLLRPVSHAENRGSLFGWIFQQRRSHPCPN
ncbi:MAG: 9 kDa triple gene block protein 3 [Plant associated potexvirus 1]|nr:MAG: 9 kDa triple gene block protein 3 [Plant associated potexvirus 1]